MALDAAELAAPARQGDKAEADEPHLTETGRQHPKGEEMTQLGNFGGHCRCPASNRVFISDGHLPQIGSGGSAGAVAQWW